MNLVIRKARLEPKVEGVPRDFYEVMTYFNRGISAPRESASPCFRYMPRKTSITLEEIRELWVKSMSENICFVAELDGRVVGSASVLFKRESTAYEHREVRAKSGGDLALSVDPEKDYVSISEPLVRGIISELRRLEKEATLISPVEFQEDIGLFEKLTNGKGKLLEEKFEHYRGIGLSGNAVKFLIV